MPTAGRPVTKSTLNQSTLLLLIIIKTDGPTWAGFYLFDDPFGTAIVRLDPGLAAGVKYFGQALEANAGMDAGAGLPHNGNGAVGIFMRL